jgi:hypothetical protein
MIADNRLAEQATWDDKLLGEHFKVLCEVDLDFNLEATGFAVAEIDLFVQGLSPAPESGPDPSDLLPDASKVQVTKPDDLWLLGRNRLLCGDSRLPQSYSVLMETRLADMAITDAPYGHKRCCAEQSRNLLFFARASQPR